MSIKIGVSVYKSSPTLYSSHNNIAPEKTPEKTPEKSSENFLEKSEEKFLEKLLEKSDEEFLSLIAYDQKMKKIFKEFRPETVSRDNLQNQNVNNYEPNKNCYQTLLQYSPDKK